MVWLEGNRVPPPGLGHSGVGSLLNELFLTIAKFNS